MPQSSGPSEFTVPALPYPSDGLVHKGFSRAAILRHRGYERNCAKRLNELSRESRHARLATCNGDALAALYLSSVDTEAYHVSAELVNHTYLWLSLSPDGGVHPDVDVRAVMNTRQSESPSEVQGPQRGPSLTSARHAFCERVKADFGSFVALRSQFLERGAAHKGSGWLWLVMERPQGNLQLLSTQDAYCPLTAVLTTPVSSASGIQHEGRQLEYSSRDRARAVARSRARYVPLFACDLWEHAYHSDFSVDRLAYLQCFWNALNWDFVCTEYSSAAISLRTFAVRHGRSHL